MKKNLGIVVCGLLLAGSAIAQVGPQALQIDPKVKKAPRSLYEANGFLLPLAGPASSSGASNAQEGLAGNGQVTQAMATKQFGTVYFDSNSNSPCPTSIYPGTRLLYSETFKTGLAQNVLFVQFSGITNVDTSPNFDGVYVICRWKQGTATSFFGCPGIQRGPALMTTVGTTAYFLGATSAVGFQSVINNVLPDTDTQVDILIQSLTPSGNAYTVCNSSLTIMQ